MSGISYYELGNVATQRMFYYIGMPTWIFNTKKAYRVTAANTYLADRLPISSTYTGLLDGAEAIYDGGQWNLVGIKSFIKGTPQMTCVFGMQGSGKSLLMNDFIIQTDCFYDYTCIIEEGNTYGSTVSQLGEKTKIISPASDICMNYFDTEGAPIDNTQISFATSFVTRMCGDSKDEDKINLRRAMLNYYVQQIYDEKFTDWQKKNRELIYKIARRSIASWKYRHLYMPSGSEEIEGWVEFRDLLNLKAERAEELYSKVTEEEIAKFLINNKRALRNNAAAWYKPEDFPQHSDLYITIHSNPNLDEHSESDVKLLSTYLKEWCAGEGASGKMFDGTSNIKNECRIDHYELGMISEASTYLKPLTAFLINNKSRNRILKMPRSSKKRINYEEVGRFMDIPGGETIVGESFAQMRKFNCCPFTIVQQYNKFSQSRIRATITGNAKQYFFFAQRDRGDMDDMSNDIYMPNALKEVLTMYPQPEKCGFSCFTYHHDDVPKPQYGTVKNIVSDEVYFISSSKGEDVENRERKLKEANGNVKEAMKNQTDNHKRKELVSQC